MVEDLDVVEEGAAQSRSVHVDQGPVDPAELALEGGPERLHGRVVVAITGRSIGGNQSKLVEPVGEVD